MGRRWIVVGLSSVVAVMVGLGSLSPVWSESPKELRVSAIPDENPTELMRIYAPFAEYLSREIGIPVRYYNVVDYAATVEGLAAKKLDMVWYGGFTFVQARKRTGNAIPVVSREEDLRFHSKFIARWDAGIKTLADLKGKSFSFGSVSSTSGHLMPRYFLLQNGINPERDFATFSFSGAHDATALWVESGKVDAGALNEAVWDKLIERKKIDPNKVKVFWTTPPYIDYVWTVRGDLDSALIEKITTAFMKLDYSNPADKALMDLQRTKKYIRVKAEQFKAAEDAAIAAGLFQ
ncbi:phosphonate ABC transporter substrate-binding protein [Candidatus Methylomirabilis lanthanidiphila]|uniref:Phosphonate ABC transporter substrate-binding protein n=1 Tax=Candidatus Methylomirabilis lanthanidiphila TaxID=2211376 RepID=A0A564ZHF9_9BACT|nr:putative selenate ABC transporter substrate-binding protein [Candidatus Methylomirabilis lanthanidiphila]VUZ84556.1 phosphonate ABC transporter substrate-binding protein [Candidatus Methylomirabilis lanthanidiphila]